jgi:hypothetical protein
LASLFVVAAFRDASYPAGTRSFPALPDNSALFPLTRSVSSKFRGLAGVRTLAAITGVLAEWADIHLGTARAL